MVGPNVRDIALEETVEVQAKQRSKHHLTLAHPLKLFKEQKPEVYTSFEEVFGVIPWYNIEEPAERVINRLGRRHNLSVDDVQKWKDLLLQ
jgi:hypothetical protein